MYLVNNEKDGDNYFNVHKESCHVKPMSNYTNLSAVNVEDAINEAKTKLGKSEIKACNICN